MTYIGELISIGVAFSWTATALLSEFGSKRLGNLTLNVLRMGLALVFSLVLFFVVTGSFMPPGASAEAAGWMLLSGVVGYVIGDFCLFQCYIIIGSRYGQLFMTLAPLSAALMAWIMLGQQMNMMSIIAMLITLPLVIYRYITHPNVPYANKPLICIFTALLSILIVGYLNTSPNMSSEFAVALYAIACIFYVFALWKFIEYRNLDFYPSFAAFTFPFVISALATKGIIEKIGFASILPGILKIEMVIAVVIVVYVLIRYIRFLKNSGSRN